MNSHSRNAPPASSSNTFAVGFLLVLTGVLFADNLYLLHQANEQKNRHLDLITEVQVLSQQMAKFAAEAAGGNQYAFDELRSARGRIQENLTSLDVGDDAAGLQALPSEVGEEKYQLINNTWAPIRNEADKILAASRLVVSLVDTVDQFSADIPLFQARLDDFAKVLAETDSSPQQIYLATMQLSVADRLLRRVNEILQGGHAAMTAADGLGRDAVLLGRLLNGLLNGSEDMGIRAIKNSEALELLGRVFESYHDIEQNVETILSAHGELMEVSLASDVIFLDSSQLLIDAKVLQNAYTALDKRGRIWPSELAAVGLGALLALMIAISLVLLYRIQHSVAVQATR